MCGKDTSLMDVGLSESYLYVQPFGSHSQTFNYYEIDLAIVLSPLSLVFNTQVGTSGDGVYSSES
jgi:hypothetical protein